MRREFVSGGAAAGRFRLARAGFARLRGKRASTPDGALRQLRQRSTGSSVEKCLSHGEPGTQSKTRRTKDRERTARCACALQTNRQASPPWELEALDRPQVVGTWLPVISAVCRRLKGAESGFRVLGALPPRQSRPGCLGGRCNTPRSRRWAPGGRADACPGLQGLDSQGRPEQPRLGERRCKDVTGEREARIEEQRHLMDATTPRTARLQRNSQTCAAVEGVARALGARPKACGPPWPPRGSPPHRCASSEHCQANARRRRALRIATPEYPRGPTGSRTRSQPAEKRAASSAARSGTPRPEVSSVSSQRA